MSENRATPATPARTPVLAALRALLPDQAVTLEDMLKLAVELAHAFRSVSGVSGDHLPTSALTDLAVIRTEETELPVSGFSYWDPGARQWVIALNEDESDDLRRFTLFHELGHIIWHQWEPRLFPGLETVTQDRLAELMADLFAYEVLMPRSSLERLAGDGVIDVATLAKRFEVTRSTMRLRMNDLDLQAVSDTDQARRPFWRPRPPILIGVDGGRDRLVSGGAS